MQWRVFEIVAISLLPVASLVFYALCLTGCVTDSPGLPNIFIIAINSSSMGELRVGYFGLCVHQNDSQNCVPSPYTASPRSLSSALSIGLEQNERAPLSAITALSTVLQLQRSIFFCLEAFAAVAFLVSVLLFLAKIYIQTSKRGGQIWRLIEQQWPEKLLMASTATSFMSAASVTQVANALEFVTYKSGTTTVNIRAGHALQVLEWLAFASSALLYCAIDQRNRRLRGGNSSGPWKPGGTSGQALPPPMPPSPQSPVGFLPPPPPPPPPPQ